MTEEVEVGGVERVEAENVYNIHITGNPLEIAQALEDIRVTHKLSYRELEKVVPFSLGQISKYLSLLRLEPELKDKLANKEMAWSTGYVLARLNEETRRQFIEQDEERITLKDAEKARRDENLRDMHNLFKDIETIRGGIVMEREIVCPKCGHKFSEPQYVEGK